MKKLDRIEQAVHKALAQTAAAVKARNHDVSYTRLLAIIDESVARVRSKGRTDASAASAILE